MPESPSTGRTNPVARALLAGALLEGPSPLRALRQVPELLGRIFELHTRDLWRELLLSQRKGSGAHSIDHVLCRQEAGDIFLEFGALNVLNLFTTSSFPPPSDLNCNMLPIRAGYPETIPPDFRGYAALILECEDVCDVHGSTVYLTVHESRVDAAGPQRRGGIHTEGGLVGEECAWHHWGCGSDDGNSVWGGIFMASTVSHSTRIWDAKIPRRPSPLLARGCDVDHLRDVLDEAVPFVMPQANEVFWMTDATPHESVPVPAGTYRQFFRLVVGGISAWWKAESTENPMVPPDADIIEHSKFEERAYERVGVGVVRQFT